MPDLAQLEPDIQAWAAERQSKKRFGHTSRVVETVTQLADHWLPAERLRCRVAAWIHDAAKEQSDADLLRLTDDYDLPTTPFERAHPMILHGGVAYALADEQFSLNDADIRSACDYHTTGTAQMSLMDKLVFLADKTEPGRTYDGVEDIRRLMMEDVDAAMIRFTADNAAYLMGKRNPIDPRMIELYNALLHR